MIKNNWGSASDAIVTTSFYRKTQHNTLLSISKKIKTVPHVFYHSAEVYIRQ